MKYRKFEHDYHSMQSYLDVAYQLNKNRSKYKLRVTLKTDAVKGIGLFATQNIAKHDIIAHYKIRVFNSNNYRSETNSIYVFAVFNKSGIPIEHLIGDVDEFCFPQPINNIPFWGQFVNEPSGDQHINAMFNPNLKFNYKTHNRCGFRQGDYLIYSLCAMRNIKSGEEILTYYGDEYERNYDINISDDEKRNCDYSKCRQLKLSDLD